MTVLDPLEGHALWAKTYDAAPNPVVSLEQRTLLRLVPRLNGLTVADIACGTGRWARALQPRAKSVVSVDLCPQMLLHAPTPRLVADAAALPLRDSSVDVTICSLSLSYAGVGCLAELSRITRPGGRVLVSDVHPGALRSGWKRSFRVDGEEIALAFRPYDFWDLLHPNLALLDIQEVSFGDSDREVFASAGRSDRFKAMASAPAVFVAMWVRRAD